MKAKLEQDQCNMNKVGSEDRTQQTKRGLRINRGGKSRVKGVKQQGCQPSVSSDSFGRSHVATSSLPSHLSIPTLHLRSPAPKFSNMAMAYFQPRRVAMLLVVVAACVYAENHAASIASMSVPEIEDKLQASGPRHGSPPYLGAQPY
jgi:hypothetical protein